jgi:signal transduction histidine kinase
MAGIGTLAGGISHEFNNLIQIMRGHTEFAQKTKRKKDMQEALDIVIDTSDKASKIIKDLLDFSKREHADKELININEQIETVLLLTEEQLHKRNIKVVRKYEKCPKISINRGELQQVLLNIITNARDAMLPRGGRLGIEVTSVDQHIKICISDTGSGIPKKEINKLFDPFYTTKGAVGGKRMPQGTGLGLSVSYGIVKRHGGTILVDSKVGKGSSFTIKLPARKVEQ